MKENETLNKGLVVQLLFVKQCCQPDSSRYHNSTFIIPIFVYTTEINKLNFFYFNFLNE